MRSALLEEIAKLDREDDLHIADMLEFRFKRSMPKSFRTNKANFDHFIIFVLCWKHETVSIKYPLFTLGLLIFQSLRYEIFQNIIIKLWRELRWYTVC